MAHVAWTGSCHPSQRLPQAVDPSWASSAGNVIPSSRKRSGLAGNFSLGQQGQGGGHFWTVWS